MYRTVSRCISDDGSKTIIQVVLINIGWLIVHKWNFLLKCLGFVVLYSFYIVGVLSNAFHLSQRYCTCSSVWKAVIWSWWFSVKPAHGLDGWEKHKASDGWMDEFVNKYNLSSRKKTNKKSKSIEEMFHTIQRFHEYTVWHALRSFP